MENISKSGEAMILESWKSGKPEGEMEVRVSGRRAFCLPIFQRVEEI